MAKKDDQETSSQQSKMAALLAKQGFEPRDLSRGEPVEGKIVTIFSDLVLVDIGAKAEGLIPLKELADSGVKVEIGAKVNSIVAQAEGDSGSVILTVKKAVRERVWEQLQDLIDKAEEIEVKGISSNRGGLIVECKGVRGFIPSSHLISDARQVIGKNFSVRVIQVNKNLNKLVFSEKEAAGESLPKIELPFKIGDVLDVAISKILPFGLLVSTPSGPDGLVHISEISWKKVSSLQEKFKTGQKLKVKVISIDPNTGRINLSIKQLEKDPWQEAAKKYKVGDIFERAVSRMTSYGAFVELEDGIEGLVHTSKIPYGLELAPGDKIKIQIDLFNSEQKRVALRLAQGEEPGNNKEGKVSEVAKVEKTTKAKVKSKEAKTERKKNVKETD